MVTKLPRVIIAAPGSGHGKTTVATGLMAALNDAGHTVSGHKVGPDYIDPGYHALATGRPGRNLDPHLVGPELVAPLLAHGARGADMAVIEGVMGLFDGQIGGEGFASTAHVAALTHTPVILVVDASATSRSMGAIVHGMASFDPTVTIAGVIVNKVGSPRHAREVTSAIGLPVLGVLGRHDQVEAPSRHLGLVPAAEREDSRAALEKLAAIVAERVDLGAVADIAATAPPLPTPAWIPGDHVRRVEGEPVVAVAGGRAFTFHYAETTELLTAAGARVEVFDPLTDSDLPAHTAGLYLGGGFPEVHAAELAANRPLLKRIRDAVADGLPTVAECAGMLYLARSVDGVPMVGAIDAEARMGDRLTLGYRRASGPVFGTRAMGVTAHEFHRTVIEPGHGATPAWLVDDGQPAGWASETLHASYLHTHWAGHPQLADAFLSRLGNRKTAGVELSRIETTGQRAELLRHHGDVEARSARHDFAVNVYAEPRPDWLEEALQRGVLHSDTYPHSTRAEAALAARHEREPEHVLATAGAAEAFGLIARLRDWRHPVIVHPQFTEPDVALRAAGHVPDHVMCTPTSFALDPDAVPLEADLVIIGNPTNPTGVLHPRETIRALLRPGRLVVVDEAFMDFVPGEPESLAGEHHQGLVVLRSLTKLWSIPGIRAGYVLADPQGIAGLRALQTPWSVSTPAVEAMLACSTELANTEAGRRATATATHRNHLMARLAELGIEALPSAGPFVLARVGVGVHDRLADRGIAVRRADTFPGLDDSWIRIAVRAPDVAEVLLAALAEDDSLSQQRRGKVTLVSAGPGDPGLMTIAARDALRRAEVIVTDRLVPRSALDWIAPKAEVIDVAKIPYGPQTSQERINELLVEHASAGRNVVRLKGGDAFVFGRGGEEVEHCAAQGLEVHVVPGVSSAIAVPSAAGIPVTHRGLTQGFTVVSGHVPPGDPRSTVDWAALAASGLTIVVLMGVRQLPAIAAALLDGGLAPGTPAAVIAEGTLDSQRAVRGTLATIAHDAREISPPAITVIGPTAAIGGGGVR